MMTSRLAQASGGVHSSKSKQSASRGIQPGTCALVIRRGPFSMSQLNWLTEVPVPIELIFFLPVTLAKRSLLRDLMVQTYVASVGNFGLVSLRCLDHVFDALGLIRRLHSKVWST